MNKLAESITNICAFVHSKAQELEEELRYARLAMRGTPGVVGDLYLAEGIRHLRRTADAMNGFVHDDGNKIDE